MNARGTTHAGAAPADARPINGARFLVDALEQSGVSTIFGYPGGAIMPFYDALYGSGLKHVLVRHEQAAALAANGYARRSGRVGVCVATSGPGATNLVTGIADAWLDSVPMIAITGQVPTSAMGLDAFQELDVFGMTQPIVKHSFLPRTVDALPEVIREAFRIASSGRPGPVLIDLPKDVQLASAAHLRFTPAPLPVHPMPHPDPISLVHALSLIGSARQPVLYGGGGIGIAGAVDEFRAFAEASGIPTVLTLRGLGALPDGHPLLLGMLGMHGSRAANMAVQESDLLIVVGARFDDRATGKLAEFAPNARVVHLDGDTREISKLRHAEAAVPGDLRSGLKALAAASTDCAPWRARCVSRAREHRARYDAPGKGIYAPWLLRRLSELAPASVVSCDVGQHQMWVAQHWAISHPAKHLTSAGLGTMGFGLPAAIGAQFADREDLARRAAQTLDIEDGAGGAAQAETLAKTLAEAETPVILVSGDGSFQMNMQELATVARERLPIKIVLLDNQSLGLVRQWQELFFAERYSAIDLSDNPDFGAIAAAYRIPALHLDAAADLETALAALLATPGPALLHVSIDQKANVWPLVPPNTGNSDMLDEPSAVTVEAEMV